MKYQAVIFDLGGTLTHSSAWAEYREAAKNIARFLSAPVDKFVDSWFEEGEGLGTGTFPSFQSFIKHICHLLHLDIPDDMINRAADISFAVTKDYFIRPREGAIDLLARLKSNGYKTGLISDCGPDLPEIWNDTLYAPYFDVTIFSCEAGMNKGDPRIFQIALEKLGVAPKDCIYIADGMRNELTNAAGLGMDAVQIFVPEEITDAIRIREDWHGPKISSLHEVYNLLK